MTVRTPDHPDDGLILALAHGFGDEAVNERTLAHVRECPRCEEWFRRTVAVREAALADLPPAASAPTDRRGPRRTRLVVTGLAAVLALALLLPRLGADRESTQAIWLPTAFEVARMRSDGAGIPAGLPEALELFANGEFTRAGAALSALDVAGPWTDLRDVYLGAARVEAGDHAAARAVYENLDPDSLPYQYRLPTFWYRAAMWIGTGRSDLAVQDLSRISNADGPLGERARAELARLAAEIQGAP